MSRTSQRLTTVEEYSKLLDKFDTFLFDCDGVIWTGPKLVPGVTDVLTLLRSRGKNILFVTNNAKKSREMYKKAFDGFGIQASVDEIFGSAYASAIYLSKILNFPKDKRVYVIGEEGIEHELKSVGIQYAGGTDPEDRVFVPSGDYSSINRDPTIGAVLCGFDAYVNYKKYAKAHTYITTNPDCHFILTNADPTYPAGGAFYPGSGAMSAPLRYSTKKTPTIIGKPHRHMMDTIMAAHHFDPERTIMIGDNLETDILFGINSNITTLLVMTGVTNESHLSGEGKSDTVPDYIVASMGDFAVLAEGK
ncbi:hypothetical protein QFC20_000075 [Naganishia adeliensis]|uniref:Uncharacterized protein n=1 Tax=Naganishia adeliensis TaxID=92952 RepID=A0ACC2X331_9TREE|nr:hypothetical protein QFC20_000075 [Naganishia adeliensis]